MHLINDKIKIISALGVLFMIIITLYFTVTYVSRINKVAIDIDIAPTDAIVRIDGKKVSRGTVYLDPGVYQIEASREGFREISDKLRTNSMSSYGIMLEPESEEAKQWVDDNPKDYEQARILSQEALRESGEVFAEKNPITRHLPYRTFQYVIGYQRDPSDPSNNSIIITIDAGEGYRQSALYRIRQLGFDPTDLNINFRDYENPFPL